MELAIELERETFGQYVQRISIVSLLVVCFFVYPTVCQAVLNTFACYHVDNGSGLYAGDQLVRQRPSRNLNIGFRRYMSPTLGGGLYGRRSAGSSAAHEVGVCLVSASWCVSSRYFLERAGLWRTACNDVARKTSRGGGCSNRHACVGRRLPAT